MVKLGIESNITKIGEKSGTTKISGMVQSAHLFLTLQSIVDMDIFMAIDWLTVTKNRLKTMKKAIRNLKFRSF
jgi:hypothetical protein